MKQMVIILLLGSWAVAMAQAPPGEPPTTGVDAAGQTLPCVPAGETATPDSEQGDAEPGSVPCVKQDPEAMPGQSEQSDEALSEMDAVPDEMEVAEPGAEASADEEFTPGDEISEDYPVPLPSDI